MKNSILVRKPEQLTRAWAQAVVALHDTQAVVEQIELLAVQRGTTTRVQMRVQHNSLLVPRRWFIKLPAQSWRVRAITALPRLLQTEVLFYQRVVAAVPLTVPRCLAAQQRFGHGAILVLGDLSETAAIVGQAGNALSAEQARLAVAQLARFHAHFAQDAQLKIRYAWLADSVRRLEDALGSALAVPLMRRGLHRADALIPQDLHAKALRYARQRRRVMAFLADAPQILTHHDCHAGNLFWHDNGCAIGFLDWQLVRLGDGVGDVAYLLATTLSPQTRREHEADLLAHYAQVLAECGVAINDTTLMQRYRAHCCYAFEAMIVTLAIGGMMDLSSNLELIGRATAAVQDLDSFAVLPLT